MFYSCQPTAPFLSPNYASTFSKWSARGRLISRSVVLTDNSTKTGTIARKPPCRCTLSRSINLSFTTKYNVDYWESKFVHNNLYILYLHPLTEFKIYTTKQFSLSLSLCKIAFRVSGWTGLPCI